MKIFPTAIVVLLFSFVTSGAHAELKTTAPSEVCTFMKDFGLVTRGWKNHYENVFGCSSAYKELSSGFPLANNLAFYVEGDSTRATLSKLVLNVNNRESAKQAHEELLKAAESLSVKATGEKLPQAFKDAIKNGKKTSGKVGSASVEVVREDWPTDKGYEIKVFIK